jgi:phage tail-like protein
MPTTSKSKKRQVPEVVGLKSDVAQLVLRNTGFSEVGIKYCESYDPEFTVVRQMPTAGSLHEEDKTVWLYVARKSLVRFLPSIYHPKSSSDSHFLRDFLWVFHHLYDSLTDRISSVRTLFNPYTTPRDFLPWLASLFGVAFDESMDEKTQRRVLKEVIGIFPLRGTKEAIVRMVRLFCNLDCKVVENQAPFSGFKVGVTTRVGVDSMVLHDVSRANTFIVEIGVTEDELSPQMLARLHKVIALEKPAHTEYFLRFKETPKTEEAVGVWQVGVTSVVGRSKVSTKEGKDG